MDVIDLVQTIDRKDSDAVPDETSGRKSTVIFPLEPLKQIDLDTSQQWLIADLMPRTGLHVLFGDAGTGKSFIALNVALHIASGRSWGGHKVFQGGVVYVASEGGNGFRKRVYAAKRALDLPEETPFALITRAPRLGGPKSETTKLVADINAQCAKVGFQPQLVVLDTLSRSIIDLRESDSQDMMRFVDEAREISEKLNALVLPVHHCGKDANRGMRGSSALHAAADAEWLVRVDPETGVRQIIVEKMKDGPGDGRLRYDLRSVRLDRDDVAGEPITTCVAEVVVEADNAPTTAEANVELGPTQLTNTLCGLRMLVAVEGHTPPAQCAAPAEAKVVAHAHLKEMLLRAGMLPSKQANAVTALRRALETLEARRLIGRDNEFVWLLEQLTS